MTEGQSSTAVACTGELWAPVFEGPQGAMLSKSANVRKSSQIASTLLKGVALLRDMDVSNAAPLEDNFIELHSNLVKVRPV